MSALGDLVDLDRYPIDAPGAEGDEFAKREAQTFAETGLCHLPGFLLPDALARMQAEARHAAPKAWFSRAAHDVYLGEATAADAQETDVGSVAYDLLPRGALRQLYASDALCRFIGRVTGVQPLHRLADPLGACTINVFRDGGLHGWHFDESPFTVTLMLQKPEEGGSFEYAPGLREAPDGPARIAALTAGAREDVVDLPFTEGTLLIFAGAQSIHRVTPVTGERPRLVPVLCYADRPGVTNSAAVQTRFWGRVA
ncbi:MAG: phytanoyl-CoA dioxygenase family protein [Pseudomonadota bacterium]